MSARTQLLERLVPGAVLKCKRNTAVPKRNDAIQTVLDVPEETGTVPCVTAGGDAALLHLPCRSQIRWINENTVTWTLAKTGRLARHSVTWEFLPKP
jgi:hypothetical protein